MSGQRSAVAAAMLAAHNTVYNLQGGILGWQAWQSSINHYEHNR